MIALLWIVQVAVFAAALAFGWRAPTSAHGEAHIALPVRIGISASLVVGALLAWRSGGAATAYSGYAACGMLWGFVGDLAMARLIPLPSRLIGGMVAFGVGHGFYIAAAAAGCGPAGLLNFGFGLGIAVYASLNAIAWSWGIRGAGKSAAVTTGALVYGMWIGIMAACMLGLAWAKGGAWWVAAAGGLSFLVSDLLIGLTEIGTTRIRRAHDWVWSTYLAGQMGIVYAGWLAG